MFSFFHAFVSSCFHFFRCFHFFKLSFPHFFHFFKCFWVFSLLNAFANFTVSSLFRRYFVFVLLYRECYGFERVFIRAYNLIINRMTRSKKRPERMTRECFLLPGTFYLTLFCAFIKPLLRPAALPRRLQGFPLRFKVQTQSICLFESRSIRQKVLLGRFYLYVRGCYGLLY